MYKSFRGRWEYPGSLRRNREVAGRLTGKPSASRRRLKNEGQGFVAAGTSATPQSAGRLLPRQRQLRGELGALSDISLARRRGSKQKNY